MHVHEELLVGGEWRKPASKGRISVVCPSTEEVIGQVPDAGVDDVDAAVQAARTAFDQGTWRAMTVAERADVLERALQLLGSRIDEISRLVTAQMGLPVSIAGIQIPGALDTGRFFLQAAQADPVSEVRQTQTCAAAVIKEPVGVVASIAPWNGPFNMAIAKIIPALVTGCSVVYKPAPETPLDAFFIAEAFTQAGLPAGVFNLITGDRETGAALVAHPGIDKVSFTGSTAAGREIGRECGGSFKRLQLELGGKSAAIVLDDADIAATMTGLAMGCFFNTGQVCAAYSRVLLPASRYDEFAAALVATAESFVVGDPFDPATTMGPLVSARQRDRVLSYIEAGKNEGAVIATGGGIPAGLEKGFYVEPTVFTGAENSMRICREEIFGPVVAVLRYDNLEQAIAIANDSDYGLHGAVFTTDPARAADVARRVRTGTFSVNAFVYNIEAPFGGVKNSGIGRDTGPEAVQAYYELKTVNLDAPTAAMFS
ncbi:MULTISPECIES: aldehyde dehydrogenase [Mycobacterium]|uniref:aldehyde dehydrogenase (NAD(+)) n=1 Tax=Mycobacterium kiyosense TaxID=2871094 RepID=A0A9P3Q415_9MYCO|nr:MULTISPECIES: aldehyde dehydrogenase [Mycobacterium]BDB44086.1 putative aldehyde dehydrogenase [Mycobacterium kiyosense]BDE15621.1 putative aldehyde dehydrogenase [Mycobacterium sp. 20KCMC460]GLB80956.1 putative aldehyde dehydrogenase [Mycobacterium kiyosense]GLB87284.1 putative aldehyde dehydrogenase [Mycobacterium kiyosense]GLB93436.1 putative aldehyde dehydrogenase [Mycobacterium kiyosense]